MSDDPQLEGFCRREYPRLVGTLTLYCGDPHVAEELAQETLMKTVRRWRRVRRMAAPGAWAHRVAINAANSFYRRRKAAVRARLRHGPSTDDGGYHDPDTADAVALREAVAALPTRQRTALVLRYYADLPTADVADHMGIEPTSVNSHVSRALAALRDRLDLELLQRSHPSGEVA